MADYTPPVHAMINETHARLNVLEDKLGGKDTSYVAFLIDLVKNLKERLNKYTGLIVSQPQHYQLYIAFQRAVKIEERVEIMAQYEGQLILKPTKPEKKT